jgi:hypothetical protein
LALTVRLTGRPDFTDRAPAGPCINSIEKGATLALQIDGTQVVTMAELAALAGTTVDAIRKRRERGTLRLEAVTTIGRQDFFARTDVQKLIRESL